MNDNMNVLYICLFFNLIFNFPFFLGRISANDFSETTFLIAGVKSSNIGDQHFWDFLQSNNNTGIEVRISEKNRMINVAGDEQNMDVLIDRIQTLVNSDSAKIVPVFINFEGNIFTLDSIISHSEIASQIFFLPRGEVWPSIEYLIQANRRIIFFCLR